MNSALDHMTVILFETASTATGTNPVDRVIRRPIVGMIRLRIAGSFSPRLTKKTPGCHPAERK